MASPEEILKFWLDEIGPEGWYQGGEDLDALVKDRFDASWRNAMSGQYGMWLTYPSGALAYIILLDQFPRNMYRGTAQAFASDFRARAAAKQAISRSWDMKIDGAPRQFFYMPLMHSENLVDQERCVRLMKERMPKTGVDNLLHAQAHREVIRLFGRFPTRNAALDRSSLNSEDQYVAEGGYGATVRKLQAAH